ncbi:MAG: hypothetical protein IT305_02035 [Chloroflexi bacterium]|nr:hypothetical protein [Chloroflexota bacterium]
MLHPRVLDDLLDDELAVAVDRHAGRYISLTRRGHEIHCDFESPGGQTYRLCLDGGGFDAEPFKVSFTDLNGRPLEGAAWPPGLLHSQHPILGRPWVCVRGAYEYHTWPGHETDSWDRYRHRIRLADLLDHLLRRCGR